MISCDNFTKSFDGDGVFDFSFTVSSGESLGILGPAGAGKSLIIRAMLGQIRPDEGTVQIFGKDCWRYRYQIMKNVAYLPSVPVLETGITGDEYLQFVGKYYGGFNPKKARRISELLDVRLTGLIRNMDFENRKKLSLLAALSRDVEVYLLDEPLNGLSSYYKSAVIDLINERRDASGSWLITSHMLDEVRRICSHVCILRKGRMVVIHPVEALQLTRQKVYHITFSSAEEASSFSREWESGVELIGSRALVAIPDSPQALIRTLARYQILDMVGGREDTEASFLRYHGDDIV